MTTNEEHRVSRGQGLIAIMSAAAIVLHLLLRFAPRGSDTEFGIRISEFPLLAALLLGGVPLVASLAAKVLRWNFSSDFPAGVSIVTAVILGEYLAGTFVVLMLSGGESFEAYAVRSASSVLDALAKRMPSLAHRKLGNEIDDIPLDAIRVGESLIVFPHEICPVDGTVTEGHGTMDESYLTGEPYVMSKTPGSAVLSGAINGESALTIRADRLAADSRYASIMRVMRDSEQRRPRLRRLGDQLGAYYAPLSIGIALLAWAWSGQVVRFLAVLVVATPCPLLIAIPVAIIGSISLAARRGIIIRDPVVLERIATCRTAIFDKTGTLTYGEPKLTEVVVADGFDEREVLELTASVERYSKHPLSRAVLDAARERGIRSLEAIEISERPGEGLRGTIDGRTIRITSRKQLLAEDPQAVQHLPATVGGMECLVVIDGRYAATLRFRDEPRTEGKPFITHLSPKHHLSRVMIVSGDRESEVRYLADRVGIREIYCSQTPEQKMEIVRREAQLADTVFLGDGINDAPALAAATVGIAFGQNSDITTNAAGAVILDSSLQRVDELLHISQRMRSIALESAVGGMLLSTGGMIIAAAGALPPVAGAIAQEIIDVLAVLNALRVAIPPQRLTDY